MDEFLRQICDLQQFWNSEPTGEMERRGALLRRELEPRIKEWSVELAQAIGIPVEDLGVKASNGVTKNAIVPWTRIFSKQASPSATTGWYVVYLFDAPGHRVHLSLIQGTTKWQGPSLSRRSDAELAARVRWARPVIAAAAAARSDLADTIDLQAGNAGLAAGYERGNVVALSYGRDDIPPSDVLARDLFFMVGLLGLVYQAEKTMPFIPGDTAPEILEAEMEAAKTAERKPAKATGQGFGVLTSEERKVLEQHAVAMATRHYEDLGWAVLDVGLKEPFDLLMTRDGEILRAEVKGTTSHGAQVVLTRREVEKQREFAPANALVIVHSIELVRGPGKPVADGGTLVCVSPWEIAEKDLTVVSYIYRTGL
ncbi:DUF3578 domain-containing protein [Embleya sp. NBC_00888]|uniref:MrcB family domain-containing protein n=1 Tax=Embleya sp. NBC_00888 TaxID=2975960 RepID=UPI00386304C0|nr:DUF3578 domain-containing protein [Embleya sp. NBC_00888]